MSQDKDKNKNKMHGQTDLGGQNKQGQSPQTGQPGKQPGQGRPEMDERGNPSTTERIQPEPNRGNRQEGEKPGTGNREQA